MIEVTADLDLGVGIDFSNPHDIGADRLANAVAVTTRYGSPAIVVDFGTAVTFDIISFGGVYEGGVIAPGLGVMTDYMYQRTALLPKIDLEEPVSSIGKTTRDAMLAAPWSLIARIPALLTSNHPDSQPRRGPALLESEVMAVLQDSGMGGTSDVM